ncbi:2-oxo acid dehydrogenase subunit E2 [Seongchinamella unica]|uniref:Dihydrolipoamide acetyltransferase component of pyruvate dehydrogenase complex n=1 Tax=Seongchinamella unica TaxID=2547392 RepID=A0A4V2ZX55_9GAMM|nr:dihydrolipoamide acetyltransferase family protein [Seongchinamella unica]TDG13334.1 2-oxo acid dehydrogenase subunit E2 [Seongchinamella unica]
MSDIYPIAIPKWGIEMVEGTINSWLKQPGDAVSKGEEILEIESDKIVNVWEAPADGILRRRLVEEGEARRVGHLLGIIAAADVDDASIDAYITDYAGVATEEAPQAEEPAPAAAASAPAAAAGAPAAGGRRASPVVRRLAEELGVDLGTVSGSGRNGRITQEDVRAAASGDAPAGPASNDNGVQITPFSATRKTTARRLVDAKQEIPHYYLSVEWEIDGLLRYRRALNDKASTRISLNDLLVYCVARALLAEPRVNINVIDDSVHQFQQANIGVAIATDDGLFPATIRGAENMAPEQIAAATVELAARAKAGDLTREDISGASFTLSNLGMFGIDQFTAIINPPAGAILALGAAQERPVAKDGELAVATVINATLSCDHRAIDGAVGASFMAALKREIDALGN